MIRQCLHEELLTTQSLNNVGDFSEISIKSHAITLTRKKMKAKILWRKSFIFFDNHLHLSFWCIGSVEFRIVGITQSESQDLAFCQSQDQLRGQGRSWFPCFRSSNLRSRSSLHQQLNELRIEWGSPQRLLHCPSNGEIDAPAAQTCTPWPVIIPVIVSESALTVK